MTLGIPFGNYRLVRRLARGGMAEVFLASQRGPEGFERTVAIKRILPHLADNPQFVEMFMDEARLAAQLSHPNIAHIYEFGMAEDAYFIAMEYIDGIDLSAVILDGPKRPIPLQHAARIIADVCAGLHYAHALPGKDARPLGLVHRDISPQNILVTFNGAVKVVDFGIAKAAHHIQRTLPGVVRGKFTYMAPEQVDGKPLDGRVDLFCAGIVLYELTTSGALFPRTNPIEAMRRVRNADIPPPRREGRPLPPQLEQILRRSLARRREDRYRDAAEMQMDLEAYLHSNTLITNSIVLGDYFREHYRTLRPPPESAGENPQVGTANVGAKAGGTVPVPGMEQGQDLLAEPEVISDEEQGDTLVRGSDNLAIAARPAPPANLSASIHGLETDLNHSLDAEASIPYQPRQLLQDDSQQHALAETLLASDELRPDLFTHDGHGEVTPEGGYLPLSSELGDSEVTELPSLDLSSVITQMPTAVPSAVTSPSRSTRLGGTTLNIRSVGRRALVITLITSVAVVGILAGYWLSNPGDPPLAGDPLRPLMLPSSTLDASAAAQQPPGQDSTSPEPPPLEKGTLRINSKPEGASIVVDGEELPQLSPASHQALPGNHAISASYPGFEPQTQRVYLVAGQTLAITFSLRPLPREADLPIRVTKKKSRPTKPRGKVRPRVKRPKEQPQITPPLVVENRFGFISITTIPWSTVYLGEKRLGITPLANVQVLVGTHRLRFKDAKGAVTQRTVTVKEGAVTKLRFNLPE